MTDFSPSPSLVRDLMTVGVFTCDPATPIQDIARVLLERDLDEVVVLEEGHNVGVVGQEELSQAYVREDWKNLTAEQVMRSGVVAIKADLPLKTAAQLMHDHKVRCLYITHHAGGVEYPAAYISYRHLVRHMAAQNLEELKNLGIKAERQSPLDVFIQRRDAARKSATKRP